MKEFIMLVGLPSSGKSTISQKLIREYENNEQEVLYLSSDKIREELFGKRVQDQNGVIFETMRQRTINALKPSVIDAHVIYDATNINSKRRKALLKQLPKGVHKKCIYVTGSIEEFIDSDLRREHSVGEEVIMGMYKNLQIPMYYEGWDRIEITEKCPSSSEVCYSSLQRFLNKEHNYESFRNSLLGGLLFAFQGVVDFPQDNPHHTFAVDKHTFYVYDYIFKNFTGKDEDKKIVLLSAIFHDIGKVACKSFKEGSRYANFYGHESVSAQKTVENLKWCGFDDDTIIEVATLVQLHMRLSWDGNKQGDKTLLQNVGEDIFKKLQLIREADIDAK